MKMTFLSISENEKTAAVRSAFTVVEVMIGVTIMAVTFASLFLGFAQGFGIIRSARENLRATQILQEQAETIRLYTWDQINSNGFIPAGFTNYFYPASTQANGGLVYTGQITISPAPMAESYSNDHRLVTVALTWTSGHAVCQRQLNTLVSRYGLHNYYY